MAKPKPAHVRGAERIASQQKKMDTAQAASAPAGPPSEPAAKTLGSAETSGYDWIKAHVLEAGDLFVTYRVTGLLSDGNQSIDDDAGDWSDDDIRKSVCDLLTLDHQFKSQVEVTCD